jgi:hypothetical protein
VRVSVIVAVSMGTMGVMIMAVVSMTLVTTALVTMGRVILRLRTMAMTVSLMTTIVVTIAALSRSRSLILRSIHRKYNRFNWLRRRHTKPAGSAIVARRTARPPLSTSWNFSARYGEYALDRQ